MINHCLELLAFIGSFLGFKGCWISLLVGSLSGSIIGIIYMLVYRLSRHQKIPFGPFLSLGAILYVLFKDFLF